MPTLSWTVPALAGVLPMRKLRTSIHLLAAIVLLLCAVVWVPGAAASTPESSVLLGAEAVGPAHDSAPARVAEAVRVRTTRSGVATAVHVYIDGRNRAKSLLVGLLGDVHGHPGRLLSTGLVRPVAPGSWNVVALAPIRLTAGTVYWLAVLGEGGRLNYRGHPGRRCSSETSGSETSGSETGGRAGLRALRSAWRARAARSTCSISAFVAGASSTLPIAPITSAGLVPVLEGAPALLSAEVAPAPEAPVGETSPAPPALSTAPPANTALPALSGTAEEGRTLTASAGAWSNDPSSFAYRWEACNAAGKACSDIQGATGASYQLGSADVGRTVRVVVTATNAIGSTSASSPVSAQVRVVSAGVCSSTVTAGMSASAIVGVVAGAAGGSTVCMAEGSYVFGSASGERMTNILPSSTVTLRAAPGAFVSVYGMKLVKVENLAIEGIHFESELESEPPATVGHLTISHDSWGTVTSGNTEVGTAVTNIPSTVGMHTGEGVFASDIGTTNANMATVTEVNGLHEIHISQPATAAKTGTRIVVGPENGFYAHGAPSARYLTAEYDSFAGVGPCIEKSQAGYNDCGAFKGGQCITVSGTGEYVTLQHDTCGPYVSVHYFQVGNGNHITIDHDLFLGPSARHDSESHQNYLQIAGASEDVEFSDNVMWHTNAENGLEIERYSAATEAETYKDFTVDDNLEVHNDSGPEAPGGIGMDLCPIKGLTFEHNTIIEPSSTGANFRAEGTGVTECTPGDDYKIEHNLLTLAPSSNQPLLSVAEGACEALCEVGENVTQDESAGGARSVTGWTPDWVTAAWNPEAEAEPKPPSGYYVPAPGSLGIAAGYEGTVGP